MRLRLFVLSSAAVALGLLAAAPSVRAADRWLVPEVTATVRDQGTGRPAAGVEVALLARGGKRGDAEPLAAATTGPDGRAVLPERTVDRLRYLDLAFSWSGEGRPRRTVRYEIRVKKGGKSPRGRLIEPAKEQASYLVGNEAGGDCTNLFSVRASAAAIAVTFDRPETYLACAEPDFKFPDLLTQKRDLNKGKLNLYSFDDDQRMGREFFDQLGSAPEQPLLEDPQVADYVQDLVDRLGRASDMPELRFRVRVIDADVLNAFALPGGYLFVYRGLIEATETESELVGVLAHEVAHVTSRHGTEGVTSAIGKVVAALALGEILASEVSDDETVRELIATAALAGTQFWIMGGNRKREAEADHLGAQYAWRAGYDPRGLASFFDQLSRERGRRQTRLDQLFSDHPNDQARVANVGRSVDYFLPPKDSLVVSSPAYLAVKERLARLPPPRVAGEVAANALFASFKAANEELLQAEILGHLAEEAGEE